MTQKTLHLWLLLLLALGACRKPQDINPQKPTQEQTVFRNQTLTASQQWFKLMQGNYKKEKGALARNADLRDLPWYPVWDEAKFYQISEEETLVIIPVWRYANVTYNQEVGFTRRLKLIVNHTKQTIQGMMAEMMLDKDYMAKYQDDLFYYAHMQALRGNHIYYELPIDHPVYLLSSIDPENTRENCGSDDPHNMPVYTILFSMPVMADICFQIVTDGCKVWTTLGSCGGNGGGNPPTSEPPVFIPQVPPIVSNPIVMPPITSPIEPPAIAYPTPWVPWLGYPVPPPTGGGISGGGLPTDPGSNTDPHVGYQPSQLLLSITKIDKISRKPDFGDLTEDEIKDLDATLQNMYLKSPLMAKVIEELRSHKIVWRGKTITTSSVAAYYDAGNNADGTPKHSITFNRDQYEIFKRSSTLIEELLHALQHKFYGDLRNIPNSNVELEAKLISDLINLNSRIWYDFHSSNELHGRNFSAIPRSTEESIYGKYLIKLTFLMGPANTNEPKLPKNMTDLSITIDGQTVDYWTIMDLFRDAWAVRNPSYADTPNTSKNPELLFWLANNCNCSHRKI